MDYRPDDQPFWHTGPEPRSRFLAIYLIALVAVGCGLIWWAT